MNRGLKPHIIPAAAVLLSFIVTAALLPMLPHEIPIHWNAAGEPDNYAGRIWGAFLLPLTALGIYLLFLVIPSLDPKRANYEKFAGTYHLLRVVFVLYMVFLQGITLYAIILGGEQLNNNLVLLTVAVLFIIIGNYMPRMRPNWFVGIRTPWTLSSEEVWRRTHRLGGQVFVVAGFLMGLAAFLPAAWSFIVVIAAAIISAGIPIAYSYWMYRQVGVKPAD
jgi:uncharacterized membrane protein